MVVHGHVENGRIVLDEEAPLEDGMKVRIEFLSPRSEDADGSQSDTLYERMKDFIGTAKNLPPDASYRKAREVTETYRGQVLTTDFEVVEVGNFFSRADVAATARRPIRTARL